MPENQINQFMSAIRRLESGSFEGNYSAKGPTVKSGTYKGERAYGAYQIMPGNWQAWARAAGLDGADMRDPKAQDAVARHMFKRYYDELQDWNLVAVAWFSGLGRARKAKKAGVDSLKGIADVTGTDVPKYVSLIRKYMTDQGADLTPYKQDAALATRANREATQQEQAPELTNTQSMMTEVLKRVSSITKQQPGSGTHDAINRAMKLEA